MYNLKRGARDENNIRRIMARLAESEPASYQFVGPSLEIAGRMVNNGDRVGVSALAGRIILQGKAVQVTEEEFDTLKARLKRIP